jgi:choline dehydrogenase-like flavoprotein
MNQNKQFDAIVVGTGISGGWAAKELCEKGLETLVLERGRMVKHIEDYPTMNDDPSDQSYKGQLSVEERNNNLYKRGLVGHPKRTTSIFS